MKKSAVWQLNHHQHAETPGHTEPDPSGGCGLALELTPERQPHLSLAMWPEAGNHYSLSFSFLLLFFLALPPEARGILVSQPGIKPASLHWRHTVITTRCRGGTSFLLFNDKGGNSLTLQRKEHRLDKYFLPSFFLPMNRKDDLKSRLIKHLEVNQGGSRE